jgi:elongation factor 1-gamma
MALKLHSDMGNFRAFKALIAAEYNGVDIEVVEAKKGDLKSKSPYGRLPVLETPCGAIFESNAIARYVARLRADTNLTGSTFFESGQVDSWIDFSAHDIELPATVWAYPIIGLLPLNAAASAKAKGDLAKALEILEAHLVDKTYLVGHHITLADICVVAALVYPFKLVADAAFRGPFPNVMRWFDTCVHQPAFENVIGQVVLATKEATTEGSASAAGAAQGKKAEKADKADKAPKEPKEKKEKAPKEPAKPKEEKKAKPPKDDDEEEEPDYEKQEKKAEHPFKIMDRTNPSPFVMDTWKKCYSNTKDDYHETMNTFWSTFDENGWSIFRGDYNYNSELQVLFMTSNLIGGFIQRTEEIRKWLFGTMTIRGVERESLKITCYYLIRGDSIQPLIDCNDDAACYTWTKMAVPPSEADKALLYDYWCSEGPLEGEPNLDSRCYK